MRALSRGSGFRAGLLQDAVLAFGFDRFSSSLFQLATLTFCLNSFGSSLLPMHLRMSTELVPVGLGKIYAIVLRSLLNVCEGQCAVFLGHIDDLIKSRHRIADMLCIRQRLFPLFRKGKHGVGKIASHRKVAMFCIGLPGCFNVIHSPPPLAGALFFKAMFFGKAAAAIGAVICRIPSFSSAVILSDSTL